MRWLLVLGLLGGCDDTPQVPAFPDVGADAVVADGAVDAGLDAARDRGLPDARMDGAPPDAARDGQVDGPPDAQPPDARPADGGHPDDLGRCVLGQMALPCVLGE